ncbi:MAG: hypothetical protein HY329_11400 [Chloroflexi bacterium]|nr:hypothetical protein [Chloroflexota bacterium]
MATPLALPLHHYAEHHALSDAELAGRLGLTADALERLMACETPRTFQQFDRLAAEFGIDVVELAEIVCN